MTRPLLAFLERHHYCAELMADDSRDNDPFAVSETGKKE
jgi:hypothetical protein